VEVDDVGDANSTLEIFNKHFKYKDDFFSTFELNVNNYLASFF